MSMVLITGSSGLVGSCCVRFFADLGFDVLGLDNDMRAGFFGPEGSTARVAGALQRELGKRFRLVDADIRDRAALEQLYKKYSGDISLVIHAAGQPSHDWAATDPRTDFEVNAVGTLNLLELTKSHAPEAVFIFTSTNKVYGDNPNRLPLREGESRWEPEPGHGFARGIGENMSVDHCLHSLFGASKLAADAMVQEYGRYYGLATACFRCGCISGPAHQGVAQHGFLSYMMRCAVLGRDYEIYGHKGKQVRDNLHCLDLAEAFHCFHLSPRPGEVYNMGGGPASNCSLLEAADYCGRIAGRRLNLIHGNEPRKGDHIWWISCLDKFRTHYPQWRVKRGIMDILEDIHESDAGNWEGSGR